VHTSSRSPLVIDQVTSYLVLVEAKGAANSYVWKSALRGETMDRTLGELEPIGDLVNRHHLREHDSDFTISAPQFCRVQLYPSPEGERCAPFGAER
jgi:hypothetical protein